MDKNELYSQLPRIRKRLFLFGIPAAVVFLAIWYFGGYHLWARLLDGFLNLVLFPLEIRYQPGTTSHAVLIYTFETSGRSLDVNYLINQLSSNMVVVVTLLATWPHKSFGSVLKLSAWCLLFLLCYQAISVFIQFQYIRIGPEMANSIGTFWEDSFGYQVMLKLSAFDKFILRYFAWFPIFLLSLVTIYFTGARSRRTREKK